MLKKATEATLPKKRTQSEAQALSRVLRTRRKLVISRRRDVNVLKIHLYYLVARMAIIFSLY